jgi:hypothetical protein
LQSSLIHLLTLWFSDIFPNIIIFSFLQNYVVVAFCFINPKDFLLADLRCFHDLFTITNALPSNVSDITNMAVSVVLKSRNFLIIPFLTINDGIVESAQTSYVVLVSSTNFFYGIGNIVDSIQDVYASRRIIIIHFNTS